MKNIKREIDYDEISFFKYLSSNGKIDINFCYLITLIIYIMNEISLSNSLKSTLNSTLYLKYREFLINFERYLQKYLVSFPASWNILTTIMVYMMREAHNPCVKIDIENFLLFIDDIILIISQNLPYVQENFVKEEKEIFSVFITFLKFIKNKGLI